MNHSLFSNANAAVKKIELPLSVKVIKEQMQKLVEQFDGTQLVQSKCERL